MAARAIVGLLAMNLGLAILLFVQGRELCAESVYLGCNTDFDVLAFGDGSGMSAFMFSTMLVGMSSSAIVSSVLHWMSA